MNWNRYIPQTPRPKHHYIVRGTDGIQDVLDRLRDGILAGDTETTGTNWQVDRVGALCFAAGDTAAFFCKDALGPAARWFADQVRMRRPLVFHDAKFDMHMMRETFGIHIPYPVHDTLIMSELVDNRGAPHPKFRNYYIGHNLKDLATYHVDPRASEAEDELITAVRAAVGKRKHPMADWLMAPMRVYGKYGGRDPWYTLRLYDIFIDMIRHWPQPDGYPSLMSLYKTERWLILALRDMEERGIYMDADYIERWVAKRVKRLEKLERTMNKKAGRILNWRSPPQICELFWDELELEQIDGRSTDKRCLLRMSHPLAALLLKHRKRAKEVSSGRAMLPRLKIDGALHARFNQNVDTGRMSASDGVHQFARDSGIRRGVIPRKGLQLRSADYSQIEMRFAAHFSKEPYLVEGFRGTSFDTHTALAKRMFGLRKKEPTPPQRDRGKTMNFAILYRAGEDAVTEQLIDKISAQEARQSCLELGYRPRRSESPFRALAHLLRDATRAAMPKVIQFTHEEEKLVKQRGFVVDAFGYHRYLSEEEAYTAMNSKLQGSAAHQAKKGMVDVYREVQLGTGNIALLMQIHDDVVYESEGNPKIDRMVMELLEDRTTFEVPIVVDLKGSAKNWQDKEKITLTRRKAA